MKTKMIPRNFVVLGYEKFKSDLNPLSVEYTDEMNRWAKHNHRENNMISDTEDLKQKELCKDQILQILRTSRIDSVYDALTCFFIESRFEKRKNNVGMVEDIRKLLRKFLGE